jgi:hypothetical protein
MQRRNSRVLGGALGLIAIAVLVVGFVIVQPVLAQEEATPSDPAVESVAPVDTVSSSTSSEGSEASVATPTVEGASTSAVTNDPPPSSAAQSEPPPADLTEVHIIGTKYVDYFTDGTTVRAFPGDPEIDDHFSEKDAPIPTHEGLTWDHSTGSFLYDTASGDLEEGQYAVQPNGTFIEKRAPFVSSTSTPEVLGASTSAPPAPSDTSSTTNDTSTSSEQSSTPGPADSSRTTADSTAPTTESVQSSFTESSSTTSPNE